MQAISRNSVVGQRLPTGRRRAVRPSRCAAVRPLNKVPFSRTWQQFSVIKANCIVRLLTGQSCEACGS